MRFFAIQTETRRRQISSSHACGFSLVELILTMVVISIAALGVMTSLSFANEHQSDGLWQAKAMGLARSYFEEILAKRFDEHTPNGGVPACSPTTLACSTSGSFDDGETRSTFDDVDDYNGLVESPPLAPDGTVRADYPNYQVEISVRYPTPSEQTQLGLDDATDAKIVDLGVTTPGGDRLDFVLIRGNY